MAANPKSGKSSSGPGDDFDHPDSDTSSNADDDNGGGGNEEFEAPTEGEMAAEGDLSEVAAMEAELGGDLASLKGEIESKLAGDAKTSSAEGTAVQDVDGSNIVGVGYGYDDGSGDAVVPPGQPALVVYTIERQDTSQLMSEVASMAGTSALSTVPIVQVTTGLVDAQSHRMRLRPAPGGISVGHTRVTAGTLGCLTRGRRAPRINRLMILSNNHVLANSNVSTLGDSIIQPGSYDGGRHPQDQIAILERFVPINFSGGINYVDCATGWAWPDRVRRELMYLSGGSILYFRIGAAPLFPPLGLPVGKTGRTTQLKAGRVTAIGVTVNVNYGGGRVAHFRDQIAIRGTAGDFSAGGDSGSAIWHWATGVRPVGLLYAGGGGTTFANRMDRVLNALDVNIVS
jgi:hypothetical protein